MSSPPAHGSGSEGEQGERDQDALDRALRVASHSGNLTEVLAQLEAGADANGGVLDGEPLLRASLNGHLACVRALLAAGADIDQAVEGPFTALSSAVLCGQTDVVRCLLEAGASQEVGGIEEIYSGAYDA
jgi:ankyrin repeat protein